jgi:hypothetical protein
MVKEAITLTLVNLLSLTITLSCNSNQNKPISHGTEKNFISKDSTRDTLKDTTKYNSIIDSYKSSLGDEFIYKGFSYFVVISNLTNNETENVIRKTIIPAVKCFYNDYFEKRPDDLTTIFLFKNDDTYRYWARKLFNDEDLSRFGYYKPNQKVMLMNISTGTGTLVHELTHALVSYDFPDIPAWFNEGLGSLYERCSLDNGIILGHVNWRLPTLQDAIKEGSYTSLAELIKLDDDSFYGKKSDFNYSQARYFCMYMQEQEVLRKFYKAYRDNFEADKTGKANIEKIFSKKLKEIDNDFVNWVKTLNYER